MALKIKTTQINGETRVPPEVMDLLTRFAHHRDICSECLDALKGSGMYCHTGTILVRELIDNPNVEYVPE